MTIVRIAVAGTGLIGLRHAREIRRSLRFGIGALGAFLLSRSGASRKRREQPSPEHTTCAAFDDEDVDTIIGPLRGSLRC